MNSLKDLLKALLDGATLDWIARKVAPFFGNFARSYRRRYYLGLAGLFILGIAGNAAWQAFRAEPSAQSLDLAVRSRLASPRPDPSIVILDIDERSLAVLAPEHGRWPWPRTVLAEAIATLADVGARSIVVNVMMSDPDKTNPQADATFNDIAAATANAVFPLVRLNAANDAQSEVTVAMLPGARIVDPAAADTRIAVLFPYFAGTHDKLGVDNLKVGADGVVRRYDVWWDEPGYALPSIAQRAAAFDPRSAKHTTPDEIVLNWRNKRGDYRRVSFADFYLGINGKAPFDLGTFRGATVIIGATAPGLAHARGTASAPTVDDNVIIATAIDDIVNDTHLRLLPTGMIALISALAVATLALLFSIGVKDKKINSVFGAGQGVLVAITVISASYTVYLVDLAQCFLVSLGYFLGAKLHAVVSRNAARGMPAFVRIEAAARDNDRLVTFAFDSRTTERTTLKKVQAALEKRFGIARTFHIDNAFGEGNLFSAVFDNAHFLIAFVTRADLAAEPPVDLAGARRLLAELIDDASVACTVGARVLPAEAATDLKVLQREVAHAILESANELMEPST